MDPYIAYCAGLFEGEGYIGSQVTKKNNWVDRSIRLKINMTDRHPLDLFEDFMGVGRVYGPYAPNKTHHKITYLYQVALVTDVKIVSDKMYEWLSPRRQQQIDDAFAKYEAVYF